MLEPRPTTPRRTAIKYAIVALTAESRRDLREWVVRHVSPAGAVAGDALPSPRTWRDVVQAALIVTNDADRAWLRAWTLRWVRPENGALAIPDRHTGDALAGPTFGRRRER